MAIISRIRLWVAPPKQNGGSGAVISNEPFGPSWNGNTTDGASKNALYDEIISIGGGFGNTAFVQPGGDDSTAQVGNIIRPFQTIQAAITALASLPEGLLFIRKGQYSADDTTLPYGLLLPGSTYDIYMEPGAKLDYFGTYGAYIDPLGNGGNIYGEGIIQCYSSTFTGSVNGVSNYAVNVFLASGSFGTPSRVISCTALLTETPSVGTLRIGNCPGTKFYIQAINRIQSRGLAAVFLDSGSRAEFRNTFITSTTVVDEPTIWLRDPRDAEFSTCYLQPYGNLFGRIATKGILIQDSSPGYPARIVFSNCNINTVEANSSFAALEFAGIGSFSDFQLYQCRIKNRLFNTFSLGGFSMRATGKSLRLIDVYADTIVTGTITNLISTGTGFVVEPNL